MSMTEAIFRSNEFLKLKTGVSGEPFLARLVDQPGRKRQWRVMYSAELFFSEQIASGSVIDGGEYIVIVDDSTGEVSTT